MFSGWSVVAKAIMSAAVAAASAYAAGAAAGTPITQNAVTAVIAFAVAFAATYAHQTPAIKAVLGGVIAGGGAFLDSFGHASALQVFISTAIAFVTGAGLVVSTTNSAPVIAPARRGAVVEGAVPRERLA